MIASTPLSPHFSPEVFGGAFDVGDRQHHATRPGNQTTLLSPGHNRPNAIHESTTATPINQHLDQQHQQNHPQLHTSALGLGLGLGTLGLTHAEGNQGLQHQFGPAAAPAPNIAADQQGTSSSSHLHSQGHQRTPAHAAAWFPPGYGVPAYHDNPQQQHVDATSSSTAAAGVNPPVTLSAAVGLSTDGRSQSIGVGGGGHLFDFGFAAPPLTLPPTSEQSFLGGGVYADITPLSTTVAVTAHPQPPTTTFDFHASPWRPRLQDSSSVTLTPNIAAVAAVELNHDVRKHSKSSMETDSDVKDPSWDDDDNEPQDKRAGAGAMKTSSSSSSPGTRKPQRKGKRRAVADPGAGGIDNDDEPTSPAGRTSVSGRSVKSVSVASSAGSSTKNAPAPRLRSASRTSKNALQKPTESLEERRTRASHNLVEKQYRNRLNAQFEGLLNALPEQVRGPAGAGDGDESDPQAAAAANEERRVSKAEVLDMARRHIQNLERERETLHRERGELLRNLETMEREAAANGGGATLPAASLFSDDGGGGGGGHSGGVGCEANAEHFWKGGSA
ncbi:hypothetical protein BDP55DRAFT_690156 [Colletotrichum godetiae]|uniref:BHLH domain-containing protein n=1 Tax=Colletotrichum godetiae TaxID=1209918 RepID=A0AAJ0EYL9_9PEZI|nr:uncharacterized protein BDP55DRAFT_690156 [Colletotrichum godetiae]KAK1691180.1 hypothetical protein BDP55DRAFT_690156 [Colletotrichum godetiae]